MGRFVKIGKITKKFNILGLDCSSSTVGWGLITLNNNPVLTAHGHIKPLNSKHSDIERLNDIYNKIEGLCDKTQPSCVAVEDVFLFMKGNSTARTITLLAAFNRVISLAAYRWTGEITFYSVHNIRKAIAKYYNITLDKENMPSAIIEYLEPKFTVIKNRNNNIAKETYDEADGIAAAWAHAINIKEEK